MAGIVKKNLEAFESHSPFTLAVTRTLDSFQTKEKMVQSREGILYFEHEGRYFQLHSQNKAEEAKRILGEINPYMDYLIILFGMGNTELLRQIKNNTSDGTRVFVFEPNIYVFQYIVHHENLLDIIKCNKFGFVIGEGENIKEAVSFYSGKNWDNLTLNIKVLSLPNYGQYKAFCCETVKQLAWEFGNTIKCLGTSVRDTLDGLKNYYRNIDYTVDASGIDEIKDQYKGCPAVIVASGPSLNKNRHLLKEIKGKALVISCDASYRICMEEGIKPDVIASIERYQPTYQFFYEGQEFDEDIVLAAPALLWPEIFEKFPGQRLLISKDDSGVEAWWAKHFPKLKFVNVGHSCANVAYAVAKEAGCSPIILIGQDLAYTDDKFHGDGAHIVKYEGENKINLDYLDESHKWIKDIYGNTVLTNIFFNLFRYFFETSIRIDQTLVIDATEGGAYIEGTELMTFREAIDTYCIKNINYHLNDYLKKNIITNDDYIRQYDWIIRDAEEFLNRLEITKQMAIGHYHNIEKYKDFDYEKASQNELIQVIETMTPGNEIVTHIVEKEPELVTYFQQSIKATILYVKNIGNEITGMSVKRNWELQMNLMYMIEVTAIATQEEFENMIKEIKEKKENRSERK